MTVGRSLIRPLLNQKLYEQNNHENNSNNREQQNVENRALRLQSEFLSLERMVNVYTNDEYNELHSPFDPICDSESLSEVVQLIRTTAFARTLAQIATLVYV